MFEQSPLRNRWPRAVIPFLSWGGGAVMRDSFCEEKERYTVDEAVAHMLARYCKYYWTLDRPAYDNMAKSLREALLKDFEVKTEFFCILFENDIFENPFNALKPEKAEFTREAYYFWWYKNSSGLPCPQWFQDLDDQFAPCLRERKTNDHDIEPLIVGDTKSESIFQPKALAPDDQAIIEGLTVADVRRMCEHSGALASVLRAVAQWQAIEKENPERMTKESLIAGLKRAARRDGWGAQKGELAEKSQSEPLRKMILDEWRPGGRPRKDANN